MPEPPPGERDLRALARRFEEAEARINVDRRGTKWSLGAWGTMNTETIGRQATTRGVIDSAGRKPTVTVEVGECGYCAQFEGEQPADEASRRRITPTAHVWQAPHSSP